jgi:hypothetical protein
VSGFNWCQVLTFYIKKNGFQGIWLEITNTMPRIRSRHFRCMDSGEIVIGHGLIFKCKVLLDNSYCKWDKRFLEKVERTRVAMGEVQWYTMNAKVAREIDIWLMRRTRSWYPWQTHQDDMFIDFMDELEEHHLARGRSPFLHKDKRFLRRLMSYTVYFRLLEERV